MKKNKKNLVPVLSKTSSSFSGIFPPSSGIFTSRSTIKVHRYTNSHRNSSLSSQNKEIPPSERSRDLISAFLTQALYYYYTRQAHTDDIILQLLQASHDSHGKKKIYIYISTSSFRADPTSASFLQCLTCRKHPIMSQFQTSGRNVSPCTFCAAQSPCASGVYPDTDGQTVFFRTA